MLLAERRPSSELGGAFDGLVGLVRPADAIVVVDSVGTALELFEET